MQPVVPAITQKKVPAITQKKDHGQLQGRHMIFYPIIL